MAATDNNPLVIWRMLDGRAGHENQSAGLVNAIAARTSTICHDFAADAFKHPLINLIRGCYPPGDDCVRPDLVVGAGHRTHLSIIAARRVYGGKSVVIMQPSLPLSLFDHCLIPEHDNPPHRDNVFLTEGALNDVQPGNNHLEDRGLVLVGGASKHFYWPEVSLLEQIRQLLARTDHVHWQLTDSPRTPDSMRSELAALASEHVAYIPFRESGRGWITSQLALAGQVWITQDSISMIYESLTAGAAIGLLPLPAKKPDRIHAAVARAREKYGIIQLDEWLSGKLLRKPKARLHEADRCADYLIDKLRQKKE